MKKDLLLPRKRIGRNVSAASAAPFDTPTVRLLATQVAGWVSFSLSSATRVGNTRNQCNWIPVQSLWGSMMVMTCSLWSPGPLWISFTD
jgi:hypothetical protein